MIYREWKYADWVLYADEIFTVSDDAVGELGDENGWYVDGADFGLR